MVLGQENNSMKKVFYILIFALGIFSCNSTIDRGKENVDPKKNVLDSFKLIFPDTSLIRRESLINPYNTLYIYLINYYDSIGPKKTEKQEGGDPVIFRQSFNYGIEYYVNASHVGYHQEEITFPLVKASELKKLFSILYVSDYLKWSSDSLWYTEDGLPENAGCSFVYKTENKQLKVEIFCSD